VRQEARAADAAAGRRGDPRRQRGGVDEAAFYGDGSALHYSEARYLLYHVELKGLLASYYREFAAHRADDPTGYATLRRVLGEEDMAGFQRRWEQFVLKLRYPEP
jgi:hypothetical protein